MQQAARGTDPIIRIVELGRGGELAASVPHPGEDRRWEREAWRLAQTAERYTADTVMHVVEGRKADAHRAAELAGMAAAAATVFAAMAKVAAPDGGEAVAMARSWADQACVHSRRAASIAPSGG